MKISDILNRNAILSDLSSESKPEVLQELAKAVAPFAHADPAAIAEVLAERESLGSTGIGGGIAIPHGKLGAVQEVVVGFGRSQQGIEYDSLDNLPVHLFFVLLTPENSSGGHLKVLAQISKMLKMDQFKERLKTAATDQEIFDIILEQDEEF